jgi:predicted neutral ceramidase superfamily lipid hydrolase
MPKHLSFCTLRDRHQQLMQDLRDRAIAREVTMTRLQARLEASRVSAAYSRMLLSLPVWGTSGICRAKRPVSSATTADLTDHNPSQ